MHTIPFEPVRLFAAFLFLLLMFGAYWHFRRRKQLHFFTKYQRTLVLTMTLLTLLTLYVALFAGRATTGHVSMYYMGKAQGPFAYGPELPLLSSLEFFGHYNKFRRIDDIAYDPTAVGEPITRTTSEHITVDMVASEVLAEITEGTTFNYWTFNDRVPGPFIRARVGDTITINLKNDMTSLHTHSVDFHATTGPGGGAKVLQVPPGETKSLTWKALNPGLYIYHCASRHSVAAHMAHGQYGLILIEPEEGLPPVDKEFYVVQGELFTRGNTGDRGLVAFDSRAMLDENPNYIIFNGRVGGLNGKMEAAVGERVRFFVGNGGVAKISSFHIIGEIFDNVYPEGAIGSHLHHNVQSTLVPAGGSTIVEFDLEVPGDYILVDHGLARMDKGAWGVLTVTGQPNLEIFKPHNP